MSNALQRTARLRAAHEANQTAIMLRMTGSHDTRATAYQLPSAFWAPRRPVTPAVPPSTPTLNWRRMSVAQVPNTAAALHRSAGVHNNSSAGVHNNSSDSSDDDCGHSDEDETFICWKTCCSV